MSYTLRGRLHSRLVAFLPVLAAACLVAVASQAWWPVELAALMIGLGVALDTVYDRLLEYQAGWLAVPLGLVELALLLLLVPALSIDAPMRPALLLFAAGWLSAQVLAHAGLPLLRLTYAEDGGELGRGGVLAGVAVAAILAGAGVVAWAQLPPTVHLAAGVYEGPIEITRRQVLEGEPGTIVKGGIVVSADGVTIRDITVVGGENGIEVDDVDGVTLERISVSGATLDGIHVRRASVDIRDCSVDSSNSLFGQGIDISYGFDKLPSSIVGCTIVGGQEGIVTHFATARIARNRVTRTTLRAISMTEMSMGMIEHNEIRDAHGVGIYCNDHSMCEIERNMVVETTPDHDSGDLWRLGFGVLVSYNSEAHMRGNDLGSNPHPVRAVLGSDLRLEDE